MCELSWRTVYALTWVLFWCLSAVYKHQNNPLVNAQTVHHSSPNIIRNIYVMADEISWYWASRFFLRSTKNLNYPVPSRCRRMIEMWIYFYVFLNKFSSRISIQMPVNQMARSLHLKLLINIGNILNNLFSSNLHWNADKRGLYEYTSCMTSPENKSVGENPSLTCPIVCF